MRLSELGRRIARRWRVLGVTILATTAAAGIAAQAGQAEYTATASLTVAPITTNPFSTTPAQQQVNIITERAILASPEVARLAAEDLGVDFDPQELRRNTEVAAPQQSQVLEVSVTNDSAEEAARQANALAKAYLEFRAQGAEQVAVRYIEALDSQIKELEAIRNPGASDSSRLSDLQNQRANLSLVGENPGRIIGQAKVPESASSLGRSAFLAGGLGAGTVLGILLALLRERTDRRVRSAARLAEKTGREVVVVRGTEDREALRWVLRSLHARSWTLRHDPAAVGLMVLPQPARAAFTEGLAGEALAQQINCGTVPEADVDPAAVDAGWPFPDIREKWQRHDALLVELGGRLGGSRIAALCENLLEASVIVAHAHTKTATVTDALQRMRYLDDQAVVLVFLDRPRRGRPRPASEDSAATALAAEGRPGREAPELSGAAFDGDPLETASGRTTR